MKVDFEKAKRMSNSLDVSHYENILYANSMYTVSLKKRLKNVYRLYGCFLCMYMEGTDTHLCL